MSGINQETNQFIYERLLAIIADNLNKPFKDLNNYVERLQKDKHNRQEYDTLIFKLSTYMHSSKTAFRDLKEWTEFQLLGPRVYSSNLRFQTHVVIQIIKSHNYKGATINNNVRDNKHIRTDLTLFGFILRKLLLFILHFCNGRTLKINSEIKGTNIIIYISGINKAAFKKLGESFLKRRVQYSTSESDAILKLCYNILSFYGGNLWSELSEKPEATLCFSLPGSKI